MKSAHALVITAFVLVQVGGASAQSPAGGGARSVASAQKNLDTARTTLSKAVQRIEKDPPSPEDLETAHSAVGALKSAIDAAAEYEAQDLELAKSVLSARKELRTHREYVDQRRANVHIHNHRRTIDQALTAFNERVRRVEAKEPGPQDFDDARAAAGALKKALDDGRQFGKQDQKFASFISETDAHLARQQKAIDDRWTLLSATKHRGVVEESRRALSASMSDLRPGSTDAQFETADRAASQLAKRLEEGKPLEAKDNAYRSDADRARNELAQARKKMDALWSEAGLARLKSEIEPAHKDLLAAGKAVRARNPNEDQLAEARTAAIVVRKLIEKFKPQAERSQAFGQYVNEVKKSLVEVEVELQRRTLDAARSELTKALRTLDRRAPTDEDFEVANSAVVVLDGTLGTVHKNDPAISKDAADARALIANARSTIALRRFQVDLQRHRAKVDDARRNTEGVVRAIQQPGVGNEQLQEAETSIAQVRALLEEGAPFTKKDRDYAQYDREVKERMTELAGRISSRRIVLAAGDGRAQLNQTMSEAKSRIDAAKQPTSTDADLEAAMKSVDALNQAIESRVLLEKQDKGYAGQADRARGELARLQEALEFAKEARALRRETVEALTAGASAADSGTAATELRARKAHFEKAIAQFRSCESDGGSRIKENRALEKVAVLVDGHPSTPKDVIALCGQRAQETEQLFKQVVPLIQFDEGPKRSFESAKGLLSRRKKDEALAKFEDCISSGLILQNRNPELKDRKFEVAGANMTLGEVTQQCIQQRKSLLAK